MHGFFLVLRCALEFLTIFFLCFCLRFAYYLHTEPQVPENGLEQVLHSGVLSVVTRNALHTHYLYNDAPMGFEYELVKTFADQMNIELEILIAEDLPAMEAMLADGRAAIAIPGSPLPVQNSTRATHPYMHMRYACVVHRSNTLFRALRDLGDMRVHIPAESRVFPLLQDLQDDGISMEIVEEAQCDETLFQRVSLREIDMTIIPDHMARRYQRYYPQAGPALSLGKPAPFVWLLAPEAHKLRYQVNRFFEKAREDGTLETLYNRHYGDLDLFDYVDLMRFHKRLETRLPRYQALFEQHAAAHGFDWRLIAAQAYQESHLNPWARSHADARGIMQLMGRTARSLGVTNIHDPAQNIEAGIRYLKRLHDLFDQAEEPHRTLIALGAYNVGQGHMLDARNLARRFNLDPDRWYNLEKTLPLLEQKKYYKDAIYGYSRGSEPVLYLRKILLYYDILRHKSLQESRNLPPE